MAKRKGSEGIIEDAILLGAPVSAHVQSWKDFSKVVNGKIVNGYCRGDWLLKFLYRTSSATMKIAGLQPIKWDDRRMCNVDLSSVVSGHMDYGNKMDTILKAVGVRTTDEIIDESRLRKSRSDLPKVRRMSTGKKLKLKSKSDSDIFSIHSIPLIPASCMQRDRSQSLDSVLSQSSTSASLNPEDLKTSDLGLSPLFFNAPKTEKSFNLKAEISQDANILVPDTWNWNAW
ncbi:Transmembrane and coiled-coil domain-containing protein 4, partial [Stegodyphus mimosarum]